MTTVGLTDHPAPIRAGRRTLALAAGFVALTVLLTWPLTPSASRVGPTNTGDGQFSIWNVAWVARTLVRDPLHLYDANIFAPHTGTLAYSEANIAAGLLAVPGWWATRNAYVAYSSAVWLSFVLSLTATYALVRRVTGSRSAALAPAVSFAFAPFVVVRLAHVQLLMTFGLPLALLAFHRFVERPGARRAVALSLALATAGLCSGYYGIFSGIAVGLGLVYYGLSCRMWRVRRYTVGAVGAVALAGLLIVPFLLPYLAIDRAAGGFRTLEESARYSADWRSYLTSTTHVHRMVLGLVLPFDRSAFPERVLFPGILPLGLALVAALGLSKGGRIAGLTVEPARAADPASPRKAAGFYAILLIVAAWLSLGPAAGLYAAAFRWVPGFTLLRAPARAGALVTLALVVLGGLGLARILAASRRPLVVGALAATFAAAEVAAVPFDLRPALPEPPAYQVLARMPPGAVAEFPFFYMPDDVYRHCFYMLHSTRHWHPLVNGYSDFVPQDFRDSLIGLSTFPSRGAFALLRDRGARYAVFHLRFYNQRSREKLLDALRRYEAYLRPLQQSDDVWLYEIVGWPQ